MDLPFRKFMPILKALDKSTLNLDYEAAVSFRDTVSYMGEMPPGGLEITLTRLRSQVHRNHRKYSALWVLGCFLGWVVVGLWQ